MTGLVDNLLPLAPTLLVLVGALVVGVVWRPELTTRLPSTAGSQLPVLVGESFLAFALGFTIRLTIVSFRRPAETFDPFGALSPTAPGLVGKTALSFPAILGVTRIDILSLIASTTVLALAIAALIVVSTATPRTIAGVLLATGAALYAIVSPTPLSLGIAWLTMALVPLLDGQPRAAESDGATPSASVATGWIRFGVSAAAIFFFADGAFSASGGVVLGDQSAPRGVPALLILLALSAAGLGPFGGVVRDLIGAGEALLGRFVARLLPIVAFLLAVRVLVGNLDDGSAPAPTLLLRGFLTILVFWSVGEALVGRLTRGDRLARGLIAPAFLVLAPLSVTLVFLGFGVLALGIVAGVAGESIFGTGSGRNPLIALPYLGLTEWREELAIPDAVSDGVRDLASLLRQVEERYDLAVGLLLALAVMSGFAR